MLMPVIFNTSLRPPQRVNPQVLVGIGPPKIGKSYALSKLPQALMLVTDPGGCDYMAAPVFDVRQEAEKAIAAGEWKGDTSPPGLWRYLNEVVLPELQRQRPVKRLVVDTIDEIEDWILADLNSRKNRLLLQGGPKKDNAGYQLDTILELGFGGGENLIAEKFTSLLAALIRCADEIVLVCHVRKGAFDPSNISGPKDTSFDIDLRGKVRKIPTKNGSAIMLMEQVKVDAFTTQLWGNFRVGPDTAGGTRIKRLEGRKILLSQQKLKAGRDANGIACVAIDPVTREPVVESFTTYWGDIYLPEPVVNGVAAALTTPTQNIPNK